ncbi:hypothetical protein L1049_028526 [Liquidambar formosana]|uniref:Uncharacterized protein n=1 Tax=Liquidambar formosana TaxID=63359 RepID=A0AAP0RKZ5_LIQFO
MGRHRSSIGYKRFSNGTDIDGHMRSHLAELPIHPKTHHHHHHHPSASSSRQRCAIRYLDHVPIENPMKYSSRSTDSDWTENRDGESDSDWDSESPKNRTRKRLKRTRKVVAAAPVAQSPAEMETAFCLTMLSRDQYDEEEEFDDGRVVRVKGGSRGEGGVATALNPRKGKSYYPQYRSKLVALLRFFRSLKFNKRHINILQRTPFWYLFEALINSKMDAKECKKFDDDVVRIIQTYVPERRLFKLGSTYFSIRESDITLIFGILSGPEALQTSHGTKPKDSAFFARRFSDGEKLEGPVIKQKIEEAIVGNTNDDAEDTVRLCCLYIFVNLLFSTTGQSVSLALFNCVENFDDMKKYAWSKEIWKHLITQIEMKHENPEKVTGCVMALLYWLCEHTTLVAEERVDEFPRFLKWDLQKLHEELKHKHLAKLTRHEVSGRELDQTMKETQKFALLKTIMDEGKNEEAEDDEMIALENLIEEHETKSYEEIETDDFCSLQKGNEREVIEGEFAGLFNIEISQPENVKIVQQDAPKNIDVIQSSEEQAQQNQSVDLKAENERLNNLNNFLTQKNEKLKKGVLDVQFELKQMKQEKKDLEEKISRLQNDKQCFKEVIESLKKENEKLHEKFTGKTMNMIKDPLRLQLLEANIKKEVLNQQLQVKLNEVKEQSKTIEELNRQIQLVGDVLS